MMDGIKVQRPTIMQQPGGLQAQQTYIVLRKVGRNNAVSYCPSTEEICGMQSSINHAPTLPSSVNSTRLGTGADSGQTNSTPDVVTAGCLHFPDASVDEMTQAPCEFCQGAKLIDDATRNSAALLSLSLEDILSKYLIPEQEAGQDKRMRTAPNIAMAPKTSWQLDFLNPRKDVDSAKTSTSSQGGLSPSAYFSGSSIGACPASPMTASASKTAACSSYLDSVVYERMENLGVFTDRPGSAASDQCLQMQDLSKPDQSTNYLPVATDSAIAALYAQAGSTSSATPRTNSSSTSTTSRADYKRPASRSPWESNLIVIHQPAACLQIPPAIGTARGRSDSTLAVTYGTSSAEQVPSRITYRSNSSSRSGLRQQD